MSWIIRHSAKGSTWDDHKYIKKTNGIYYYPDSYEGGRHLPDSEKTKYSGYTKGDSDFDDSNYTDNNRIGNTEFHSFVNKNGDTVILEEDMKWILPKGVNLTPEIKENLEKLSGQKFKSNDEFISAVSNTLNKDSGKNNGVLDVEATARAIIRGEYGNGKIRKDALGENYAEVQKRVNELMKGGNVSKKKDKKNLRDKGYSDSRSSGSKGAKSIKHSDELYHFGILGMKWGIRRYQNKDGSLTSLGRKRLNRLPNSEDYNKAHGKNSNTKNIKSLSDAELRQRINRLQMEQQYKQLDPGLVGRGKRSVNTALKTLGTVSATTAAITTVVSNYGKIKALIPRSNIVKIPL